MTTVGYQPTLTRLHSLESSLTICLVSTYHQRWQKATHTKAGRAAIDYAKYNEHLKGTDALKQLEEASR